MLPFKTQGDENGIHWVVEPHGREYVVAAYNGKTNEFNTAIYTCEFAPIAGIDVVDSNGIEAVLDKLIKEASCDGL